MEIDVQGTFTPLVFMTTGRMTDEHVKYHSRQEGRKLLKRNFLDKS